MSSSEGFSKGRSPRYPRVSLNNAVGYARKLYDEAHRSAVDPDTAARLMGFRGKSGASAVALGAVRQFGLVDGLRGSLRISDVALRILQPVSAEEEEEARHEAAFRPEVFDSVLAHFEAELPRSDEPIKAYLIRTLGFSRAGAEDCVASLRKTLIELDEYRSEAPRSVSSPPASALTIVDAEPAPVAPQSRGQSHISNSGEKVYRIPLTRDCSAELQIVGEVTEAAIERLIRYIELMKDVWAES
ncbi:MAG: hypothetical protein ABIQ32_02130 [Sphingomicrobium sp.]